jgi:hypothetical protein
MKTKKNTLFIRRGRKPCYRLILMILLFLKTQTWAIPTVPLEEDAVASTTPG